MSKELIQPNDILYFANGEISKYSEKQEWILDTFYDDELKCKGDSAWDIIKIMRSSEKEIYNCEEAEIKR